MVVKPSEEASVALNPVIRLSSDILPDSVLNVVNGGPTTGEAMTGHEGIGKLSFTGSVPVGKAVMQRAAETVTPVSLELGGKNPLIVFLDADIEQAAEIAAGGLFFNTGQSCGALSRALVHESVHDEFIDAVIEEIETDWLPGDPLESSTIMGPLSFAARHEEMVEYVESGTDAGATLVRAGSSPADDRFADGHFFSPTVFDEVETEMRIAQEEIFGPVLSIMPFSEYDEAISLANDVSYGLLAGLATEDMSLAHRAAAELDAGSVWVNEWYNVGPGTPFGGYKKSGIGRECTEDTLDAYRQQKAASISLDDSQNGH
ncbi:MAG: aldehyde dehydrogenase (NAD+) [Natronomonas sp.]